MSDLANRLADQGIYLKSWSPGSRKMACPKCGHARRGATDLSVTVAPDGVVWKCHSAHCGWSGGVKERQGGDQGRQERDRRPPTAPRPKKAAQPPNFRSSADGLPPRVLDWFAKRGITQPTLTLNKISAVETWMPGDDDGRMSAAIAFPYCRGGQVVNVKYRTADKRFRQEKDAERVFYGLDNLILVDVRTPEGAVVIVEGEVDALSLNEAGHWHVLSVPDGAPAQVREEPIEPSQDAKFEYVWNCYETLAQAKIVILAVDADGPGRALEEELARRIGKDKCWRVRWPCINDVQRKDANEVLLNDGADVLRECIAAAEPFPIRDLYGVEAFEEDVWKLYHEGYKRGLSTGWPSVDRLFTIRPGDLTILTGAPSAGKS